MTFLSLILEVTVWCRISKTISDPNVVKGWPAPSDGFPASINEWSFHARIKKGIDRSPMCH